MCCGKNRQQFLGNLIAAPRGAATAGPLRARPAYVAPRAPAPAQPSRGSARSMPSRVVPYAPQFEYIGRTALTVAGPVTRQAYYFDRPGARLAVDPRDSPWLMSVPHLRPVTRR